MPAYELRKRDRWIGGGIRVTQKEVPNGRERWRASFRYIWDADDFIRGVCAASHLYRPVDGDYYATDLNPIETEHQS